MGKRGNGEGTIVKRGESYRAQVYIDGRRLSKTFKRRADAQKWLRDTTSLYGGKSYEDAVLNDLVEAYINQKSRVLAPQTIEQYWRLYELYIKGSIGKKQVTRISPAELQDYYNRIVEKSVRTAQIVHVLIRASINIALKTGLVPRNPADFVTLISRKKIRVDVWSPEEVREFLKRVEGHKHELLYRLAFSTGARISELIAIQWQDINFERGTLTIQRQILRDGRYTVPKTASGKREIPLQPEIIEGLRTMVQGKPADLVFTREDGRPLSRTQVSQEFLRLSEGMRRIRFHDIRHTVASYLLANGVPVATVSRLLGHSSSSITMSIYAHYIPGTDDRAVKAIKDLFNG